jgi:peptidoglycan/LPS O-acetylase OafA/YrhL
MMTIKQFDHGRNNNFDLIRFLAASVVILSHSFSITRNYGKEPLYNVSHGLLNLGTLGVFIFFCVSGFLITKSMLRQPSLKTYLLARCLRIFPGLVVAAIFCGLIIGPLCTVLPLNDYFKDGMLYDFMWRHITLLKFGNHLPGTFEHLSAAKEVNTPTWTLPAELLFYGITMFAGVIVLVVKKQYTALKPVMPFIILMAFYYYGVGFNARYMPSVYLFAYMFACGACFYLFRGKAVLSIFILLLSLALFAIALYFKVPHKLYFFGIVLAYALFVFAYHPRLQVRVFHKVGDYSYGLYIYAFPIQQMVQLKFPYLNTLTHFSISFLITLPLACLSWHFIEKPALSLKTAAVNIGV